MSPEYVELFDRVQSLRTAVVILGITVAAMLAFALFVLLSDGGSDSDSEKASAASVSALDERLDDLESQVDDAATKNSVSGLRDDLKALSDRVTALEKQGKADDQLSDDVQDLEKRIDALEKEPAPTPTPTPTPAPG